MAGHASARLHLFSDWQWQWQWQQHLGSAAAVGADPKFGRCSFPFTTTSKSERAKADMGTAGWEGTNVILLVARQALHQLVGCTC